MQTFLPHPSFGYSASVLDDKRLGKQRVETLQIMSALVENKGWVHHPATKMWQGYEFSLLKYQYAICYEWYIFRGYADTCLRKTIDLFYSKPYLRDNRADPWWLGNPDFHAAHRSNLIHKDPDHYGPIFSGFETPLDMEYVWPV